MCGTNANNGHIMSIFRYENATDALPTSEMAPYTEACDADYALVPFWNAFVPSEPLISAGELGVSIQIGVQNNQPLIQWGINFSALEVNWEKPVVPTVLKDPYDEFPRIQNVIRMPDEGKVSAKI